MAKQTIQLYMWPVNSQGTPIVNTVTYPERSVTLVDGVYQARIQKPGIGQVIQVKLSQEIVNQFKIRLVRGDETLVTEALLTYIKIKKSTRVYQTVTYTFDSLTGYWTITSEQDFDDANGYWLEYLCSDGILTQYPYKYKTADKNNTSNLQSPGTYQDIIPYWKIENLPTTPVVDDIQDLVNYLNCNYKTTWWVEPLTGVRKDRFFYYVWDRRKIKYEHKIYSSIPYKAKWTAYEGNGLYANGVVIDGPFANVGGQWGLMDGSCLNCYLSGYDPIYPQNQGDNTKVKLGIETNIGTVTKSKADFILSSIIIDYIEMSPNINGESFYANIESLSDGGEFVYTSTCDGCEPPGSEGYTWCYDDEGNYVEESTHMATCAIIDCPGPGGSITADPVYTRIRKRFVQLGTTYDY